jgi:hypothetical protein
MRRSYEFCPIVLLITLAFWAEGPPTALWAKPDPVAQSLPFSPQFMGMHTLSPTRHWPTVPIGTVRPAGTTWGTIEKARGAFDWWGVDTWVAQSQAHGVQLIYVFLNTPQWASTRPNEACNRGPIGCAAPPNDADWQQFVTAVVTRYKGRIASYELWNEPNAIGFFTGSAAEMAHLAMLAYQIIKAIDPQAIVVSPGTSSTGWPTPYDIWIDQFLQAGGGKYVDVISWHAYAGRSNQPANPPEDVANQITKIRRVMAKNGLSNLPLWDTEGSWGNDSQLPDPQQQAAFLARWYLIQFSYGIARAYWYQWDNPTVGTLWREGSGTTPAALAFAQVHDWLNGATSATPCASGSGSTWICDVSKGNKKYRVVWTTSGSATFSDNVGLTQYSDLSGAKHTVDQLPVAIGSSPIFFQVQ